MKPRIFIGSSVEGLDLANAIQENLTYDAECTVWNQGIFKLSSNALDDLIASLDNFDFGIFVFKPDDLTQIRQKTFETVRDNVVFELGLFIGRLGKERVFFVLPEDSKNFHLPSDLSGVAAGLYNANRSDDNLLAALGVFCNQVRSRIKDYIYTSISDIANESKESRKIAIEKKGFWEALLFASLLKSRMSDINLRAEAIRKQHVYKKVVEYDFDNVTKWLTDSNTNIMRLVEIATNLFNNEISKSFGEPGVSGEVHEIKSVVDKIANVCNEVLNWELDVQSIKVPTVFQEVQTLMQMWSDTIINAFNSLPAKLEAGFSEESIAYHNANNIAINIEMEFEPPHGSDRINEILDDIGRKIELGIISLD